MAQDNPNRDDFMSAWTTAARVPLDRIIEKLGAKYPPRDLVAVPGSKRAGGNKLTATPEAMKRRIREVFGPGWRGAFHGTGGRTIEEIIKHRSDGGEYVIWAATINMCSFDYQIVGPAGQAEWVQGTPISDYNENESKQGALRGVVSSWLKQAISLIAGFSSETGSPPAVSDRPAVVPQRPTESAAPPAPLTLIEQEQLRDFAHNLMFSDSQALSALDVKHIDDWPTGLEAAKSALRRAADEGTKGKGKSKASAQDDPLWDEAAVKLLLDWAGEFEYSQADVLSALGIKRFGEWKGGYKQAVKAILAARGEAHDFTSSAYPAGDQR